MKSKSLLWIGKRFLPLLYSAAPYQGSVWESVACGFTGNNSECKKCMLYDARNKRNSKYRTTCRRAQLVALHARGIRSRRLV